MPMTTAGLVRYFDDSPEKVKLKPEYIVGVVVGIIILELLLYIMAPL